jgi:hypothetical protein
MMPTTSKEVRMAEEKKESKTRAATVRDTRDTTPVYLTADELQEKLDELEGKSAQAQFSSYKEVEPPEAHPPFGRLVEQTLGEPSEGAVAKRFGE